jgi:hypothetical protein
MSLVDVDHDDVFGVPAQRDRSSSQVILAPGGFGVGEDLFDRGLPDI